MTIKLKRLWIQLTADRRRFTTLCAVLAVAMLLWARLIVVSRMPRVAVADETQSSRLSAQAGPGAASKSAQSAPQAVRQVELEGSAARDPFVISHLYFPRPTSFTEPEQVAGKSQVKPAEDSDEFEARLTSRMLAAADRLKLEAAVAGSMAVINGRPYRAGDQVEVAGEKSGGERFRFRLEEVRHRSAILECLGRQIEIRMPTPGGP